MEFIWIAVLAPNIAGETFTRIVAKTRIVLYIWRPGLESPVQRVRSIIALRHFVNACALEPLLPIAVGVSEFGARTNSRS